MAQVIKTISLNKEQARFIDEHRTLSLSKIVQVRINELMELDFNASKDLKIANVRIKQLNLELDKWKKSQE